MRRFPFFNKIRDKLVKAANHLDEGRLVKSTVVQRNGLCISFERREKGDQTFGTIIISKSDYVERITLNESDMAATLKAMKAAWEPNNL